MRRGLDHQRRHRLLEPLRLPPRLELLRLPESRCLAGRVLHERERLQLGRAPPSSARSPSRSTAPRCSPALPATHYRAPTGLTHPGADAILPADLDGSNMPPAGAPNSFLELGTRHQHLPAVSLPRRLRRPRRTRPSRCSPTSAPAGFTRSAGTALRPAGRHGSPVSRRARRPLMFRARLPQLRRRHESLVGNISVLHAGMAGIRWFEITNVDLRHRRRVVQQSTYQPDTTWRWMGSAAMDQCRRHRARLQRLQRLDQPGDPVRRPPGERSAEHARRRARPRLPGHREPDAARATAGATTAT